MMLKVILSQGLRKNISNLILGTDREDLDWALTYKLTKMVIDHIDVFGSRVNLGEPSQFKST